MRDRLIKLLNNIGMIHEREAETVAEYLLDHGVIVPPCNIEQSIYRCGLDKADVVEVVRCKDCAFAEKQLDYGRHIYLCLRIDRFVRSIDFCSFGERKEQEE